MLNKIEKHNRYKNGEVTLNLRELLHKYHPASKKQLDLCYRIKFTLGIKSDTHKFDSIDAKRFISKHWKEYEDQQILDAFRTRSSFNYNCREVGLYDESDLYDCFDFY